MLKKKSAQIDKNKIFNRFLRKTIDRKEVIIMEENFEIKHNLKGAFFLGSIISVCLLIIFLLAKGFAVPYIKEFPSIFMIILILFIGLYITWSNYYLRKIVVEGEHCIYVNIFGKKKFFSIDNIGNIVLKDNDNVFFYDNNGIKICKIESNMINLEKLRNYVLDNKGSIAKCSREELENNVKEYYKYFTNCLKGFFTDKERLDICLEYGLQKEEKDNAIFYILKVRAKNENGYFGQNFLKIGYWEYTVVFIGYQKEQKTILYCDKDKLEYYINEIYKKLIRMKKKENIIKEKKFLPYKMMETISI